MYITIQKIERQGNNSAHVSRYGFANKNRLPLYMYICVRSLKEDVNRYSSLTKTEAFMMAEMVISCKNQTIRLRTSVRVLIFILASLTILALTSFLFSNNQIMAQSGNLGRQPPPTQQFPPVFAPNNFVKFPRLQIVQRAGPSD